MTCLLRLVPWFLSILLKLCTLLLRPHSQSRQNRTSKAVLLLWIFYVFVLSCVCYVFVRVCLYLLCGHLLGKGWPLGSRLWCLLWVCDFPIGILGQVWYLIVSIPDLCTLTYFVLWHFYSTLAFMETINNLFRNVLHLKDLIWYTYMLLVNIGGNSFAFANWYTSQRQSQVEERNSLKVSNTISSKSFQK